MPRSARGLCAAVLGLLVLGGTVVPGSAGDGIQAVTVTNANGRLEFHIEGTGDEAKAQLVDAFVLSDPDRLIVDLPGLEEAIVPDLPEQLPEGLEGIRWAVYRDDPDVPVVRYVMELSSPAQVEVTREATGTTVCARPAVPTQDFAVAEPYAMTQTTLHPVTQSRPADTAPPLPDMPEWAAPWASDTRTMSLDVQGAAIHAVLRSIAEFAGENIVADRDVTGEVIMAIEELTWPRVLEAVCLSQGLRVLPGDGVIRVATLKTVQSEEIELESAARRREELMPLSTGVIPVTYARAGELGDALSFLLSTRGRLNVDDRTNSLLVTDIPPRIAALQQMVLDLDSETVQVEIRAKLIDADASAVREMGISWNLSNLTKDNVTGNVSLDMSDVLTPAGEFRLGVVDNFGELDAMLQLLEDQNDAKIISNPAITTVSNREASILVGKEVPLIVLDEAGNPTTELKKVGITLRVTPVVNKDGRVTLDLHPEVSDLSSQATVQGGVVFTTTQADTRVMVNSGQTAVIGGLVRESVIEFERGLPILMDIPILGHLFKSTSDRTEARELLIFVTPTIIKGVAQLTTEGEDYIPH